MNKTKTTSGSINTKTPPTTSRNKQHRRKEGCKRRTESHVVPANTTTSMIGFSSALQVSFYF
jgi:hypothetical protein